MIFKRFYKVLLLLQEGNCPQTANVSHILLLLAAISGWLKIHLRGRGQRFAGHFSWNVRGNPVA